MRQNIAKENRNSIDLYRWRGSCRSWNGNCRGFSRKEQTEKGPKKGVDHSLSVIHPIQCTQIWTQKPSEFSHSPITLLRAPGSRLHYRSSLRPGLVDSVETTAASLSRSCHTRAPKPAMAAHFTRSSQAHTTAWEAPPSFPPPPTLLATGSSRRLLQASVLAVVSAGTFFPWTPLRQSPLSLSGLPQGHLFNKAYHP